MTLYDHFHGLPTWVRWLNGLSWVLALWLIFWPVPYLPLVIVVGLAPLAFLVAATCWPDWIAVEDGEELSFGRRLGRRLNLTGLWSLAGLATGLRAISDVELVDWGWPLLVCLGLAFPMTAICVRAEGRLFSWATICNAMIALFFSWGAAVQANVLLDPSPGKVEAATIIWREDLNRSGPDISLRLADGEEIAHLDVSSAVYEGTIVGGTACLDINPGLFGWRTARIVSCTAPLRDLTPPAPSTPSPPR
ncbi:hypothetical protein [Caulobacter sp. NIBR1757]|uniref:hypothetical protein n=1 Tax=Caulobacter sp. NIBR1757 TaxID=3016000 RepID=UPI0022F0C47A|nr:hypothetical protein [Caulobacter sp. NIBR1757]WGM40721.1 hypothetical protein AMEJIAPC_03668 [Caulobacter sp. NIBR1757]